VSDTPSGDLRLVQLSKSFETFTAVHTLDLTIPQNAFFALLGPSGCGKTTTLRMIAGLEDPTSGSIYIGDTDITETKAHKRNVNTVFQSYALFPHMTIIENVAFGLKRRGDKEAMKKAQEALMKAAFAAAATKANVIDVDAAYKLADLGSVKADLESMSVYPVDKDGKPLTKDGKPVTGLDDVVTALLTAKPYLKAQGGVGGTSGQIGGGTNPPGAGGAEVNPWKKETFNLTQQAKVLRENPTLAARFKAEAGVK